MRSVSLLGPATILSVSMDEHYAPYVSADLLARWKANPSEALGRETSSPYPARIQIGQQGLEGDTYIMHGTVVEVTQDNEGENIVGTYPVEFKLQMQGDRWVITEAVKGDYSQIPARQTITGTYDCLPHRNTTGPQTAECAFGIREDGSGDYYAINTMLMSSTDWMTIPTGSKIRVDGVVVPFEQISTNTWQRYDIVGVVSATSISEL